MSSGTPVSFLACDRLHRVLSEAHRNLCVKAVGCEYQLMLQGVRIPTSSRALAGLANSHSPHLEEGLLAQSLETRVPHLGKPYIDCTNAALVCHLIEWVVCMCALWRCGKCVGKPARPILASITARSVAANHPVLFSVSDSSLRCRYFAGVHMAVSKHRNCASQAYNVDLAALLEHSYVIDLRL